jgi:hypothetical protein
MTSDEGRLIDLWRQRVVGDRESEYKAKVPAHGVVLVKILPDVRL